MNRNKNRQQSHESDTIEEPIRDVVPDFSIPPSRLYRVHYHGTQTSYSETDGFKAAKWHHRPTNGMHFRKSVNKHREGVIFDSCYISTFTDENEAKGLAIQLETEAGFICDIAEIDPKAGPGEPLKMWQVLYLQDRMERRGFGPIVGAPDSEYLVLNRIPSDKILSWSSSLKQRIVQEHEERDLLLQARDFVPLGVSYEDLQRMPLYSHDWKLDMPLYDENLYASRNLGETLSPISGSMEEGLSSSEKINGEEDGVAA